MFGILFAKTFFLVGLMLVITTIAARINKEYETTLEFVLTFFGSFLFLFGVTYFSDIFPLNILLVSCFAGIVGWSMGPTITHFGRRFKLKRFLKARDIKSKSNPDNKNETIYYTENKDKRSKSYGEMQFIEGKELEELFSTFEVEIEKGGDPYNKKWQNIVFQAMLGTTIAVLLTAALVSVSSIDFSFLGMFLFISLLLLIIISVLNMFFFKSQKLSLVKAYFGVLIFTLYLVYDFNRLEQLIAQGDTSWSSAVDIAVNLYLDIINLFLDLLQILAD